MSWLLDLYNTYKNNSVEVGKVIPKYNGGEYTLLPIAHTTQTAHVEVTVGSDGQFIGAAVIEKGLGNTLIPTTENSASRAGKASFPYPLHDKLAYTAGDYQKYLGIDRTKEFNDYLTQLKGWADSKYSHPKIVSIYNYVKKGTLIEDLIQSKVLHVDQNQQLIGKWDSRYEEVLGEKPEIFKVVTAGQEATFVRFNVYDPSIEDFKKVWNDPEVFKSYIDYNHDMLGDYDLCYVSGEFLPSVTKHANKIRNSGDKAKLISANDSNGFTFRGRFDKSTEAAAISFDVSQKSHNALKWLINKQGIFMDNRVFIFWQYDAKELPSPLNDTLDLAAIFGEEEKADIGFTNEGYARMIHQAMKGYRKHVKSKSNINVLVLDSATTGRMSVQYYRNMDQERYFAQIEKWHLTCAWLHRYRKDKDGRPVQFMGAPSSRDIALAAYGPRVSDKVVKGLMERLLPCVLDGRILPLDIIRSTINRASNPVSMEHWEWEKTLGIACALISRKNWERNKLAYKIEEGIDVRVREEEDSRDYLFGRLLAVADVLERSALGKDETRATNAIRYMSAFSKNPMRTWGVIQSALLPYQAKLGSKAGYYSKQIDDIASRISMEEFTNRPLSEEYLLGFYSQRYDLYQPKTAKPVGEEI
ncbi:type I-C CRISPR-associated protein Cas8c/Csd1 [Sutcliffiella rhizosphaerae]|uniref:Type I-C CRISPR-associated protein Cas8c/Csd1 n=1 Tax=Sutcliffiella rhizosphaerae TaxID=2880967 RepID=A0ABM8YT83_9BACI|nr:type I-C CRISPR-associated protein Cas8c/Csd1 [Sutcliffiella rhizosphaerae]CAG9623048.1 hypothetical protein BACCIP111883_03843 [Sutcliffiella rhizosphaerae]